MATMVVMTVVVEMEMKMEMFDNDTDKVENDRVEMIVRPWVMRFCDRTLVSPAVA